MIRMFVHGIAAAGALASLHCAILADTPLTAPHPGYDLFNMRPDSFQLRNGGIDFLSDGRMVVTDWGADMAVTGKVFLLSGMEGTDRTKVAVKEFASNLKEPLGVKVVNDTVYVMCKDGLYRLPDADRDGAADRNEKAVGGWSYPPTADGKERWHLFAFGLLYKDGYFYGTLGSEYPPSATQGKDRGSLIKMNARTGAFEVLTGGLRTPNGIGFGPEGEIFGSENQGHWMPSNRLNNFRKGRNYGMHNDPAHPYDIAKVPASPPAVWIDQGNVGLSPSQPLYITRGPYQGQMLIGDVSYGGLQRIYLEKVDGEWQGGIVRFAGGFEAGTNRLAWGDVDEKTLYVGQIGNGGTNWGWRDKRYGLTKLVSNGKTAFEILAARSRRNGMELEFTEALSPAALDASRYKVKTWENKSLAGYGEGNHLNGRDLTVKSVRLSTDNRSVFLELDGLTPTWILDIVATVASASGKASWSNETWYTLNNISTTEAFAPVGSVDPRLRSPDFLARDLRLRAGPSGWSLDVPFHGDYRVDLRDWKGSALESKRGRGPMQIVFPRAGLAPGAYFLEVRTGSRRFAVPAHLL